MTNKIYQIKISLDAFKPEIWRRILISPETKLSLFHELIQVVMGWENSHLHHFIKNETYYSVRLKDDIFWEDGNNVDYIKMQVSDLLKEENEQIKYEYDFGDGWMHTILLEKILPANDKEKYPICVDGKMHCPPEDSGGIWGYSDMLRILGDPDHEEHEEYKEWCGKYFDPKYFDKEMVNLSLSKKAFRAE